MSSKILQQNTYSAEQQETEQQIASSGPIDGYEERLQFKVDAAYMKKWLPPRRRMHEVSRPVRIHEQLSSQSVYEPIMVSLGPYHHGKKELREVEEFKLVCLHWFVQGNCETKVNLHKIILGEINQVKECYPVVSIVSQYSDNYLALMMLLDACFIINFMRTRVSDLIAKDSYNCLGMAGALPFAARDIMLLENQIPFFVLKRLYSEIYGSEKVQVAVEEFLIWLMSMRRTPRAEIPKEVFSSLHLLEACRRVLVNCQFECVYEGEDEKEEDEEEEEGSMRRDGFSSTKPSYYTGYASNEKDNTSYHISCPSVTYLISKGIQVCPSSSHSLKDIQFESHALYGKLQLPICYVSNLTLVFLSNMIAYEVAPDNTVRFPDLAVLSYTNFMKALIQTPADVFELQQKGILRINRFANQEQVVKLFQSIDTFNLRNVKIYHDVMIGVGEHCNSKSKTWMADLIHGKLNSPWTIMALFSATTLLILTFLQTFFTINPAQHPS